MYKVKDKFTDTMLRQQQYVSMLRQQQYVSMLRQQQYVSMLRQQQYVSANGYFINAIYIAFITGLQLF